MTGIALATEDELSEAIGRRLVAECSPALLTELLLRRNGSGYLRARIRQFCEMARRRPVLLITDLDRLSCPSALLHDWLGTLDRPPSLLCRVAVREAESWVLADHETIRSVWGKPHLRLPDCPDDLDDPKQYLIELAKKAPRLVREAIVPQDRAIASKGLGYNALLTRVVATQWDPSRASCRSPSLSRARSRLAELALMQVGR